MNELDRRALLAGAGLATFAAAAAAGPLNPPSGPVAPTPGPEPRTPVNSTNTPGTGTSLFRISQPGSYYLTGNVQAPAGWTGGGIEIAASDVSLDLMGFSIVGVAGSGNGVNAPSTSDRVRIHNGSVRLWGGVGLLLSGSYHILQSITAFQNGANGISGGTYSVVTHCTSANNGAQGFALGAGTIAAYCAAHSNGQDGFVGGDLAIGCTSNTNADDGFASFNAAESCVAFNNSGDGFVLVSSVQRCFSEQNSGRGITSANLVVDCVSDTNTLGGISVGTGGSVRGCWVYGAGTSGIAINLESRCYAGHNSVVYGTTGIESSIHCTIEHNQVSLLGNTTTPGAGIQASNRCVVRNNHVADIQGAAYTCGTECVVTGNTATDSTTFYTAAAALLGPVITTQAGMNTAPATANYSVA